MFLANTAVAKRLSLLLVLLELLVVFMASCVVSAAEVDQFSRPAELVLNDSSAVIAAEVQRRMNLAIKRANRPAPHLKPRKVQRVPKQSRCSIPRLYDSMAVYLARPIVGQIESYAETVADNDGYRVALNHSIYRNFTWPQSPSLVLSERVAAVIRVGGEEVGTDKMGHFFTEGHTYFEMTKHLTLSVEEAILFGEWTESVYFGAQTTGIYSYADLVANFNGLRFWNRILALQPDPLLHSITRPYVRCEDRHWVPEARFSWVEYVDSGWNESVNCPVFRTLALLEEVLNQAPLCMKDKLPKNRYDDLEGRLFNRAGLAVMPDYLQPEVLWLQREPESLSGKTFRRIKSLRERFERWRLDKELELLESRRLEVQQALEKDQS
ncbi:hypothetical protein [Thalassolituus sp.]|uniref:hypothetical protein n=1 Tax=Thalassolituus sp. TaxID=2030822 RepID=UPI002A80B5E8|nr:hypothetical protein [Thalassolituus sp.]